MLSFASLAQNQTNFEEANTLYNEGKYAEAIDKYSVILDTDHHSASLYFNLANAHYKLNNIAPSIYYYEKALQLAPTVRDIKYNLAVTRHIHVSGIVSNTEAGVSSVLNKTVVNTGTYQYAH